MHNNGIHVIISGRSTETYRSANMHVLAVQDCLQNRVADSQLTGNTEIAVTG